MSDLAARRTLLTAVDKLVRKPSTMGVQDMADIFFSLSEILSESFGEPVQVTTIYSGRKPVVPTHFPDFSEAELEQERLQFVEFLRLQSHVLNVGYCPNKKQFLLKEDQAAWEVWIYRALLQKSITAHSKETLERFNAHFLTTSSGKLVHETVMSFWHSEQQCFLIGDIQRAFEEWLKDNEQ
jgi:hypothetical protein